MSQKMVDRSVRQQLARYTTRKEAPCRLLQGRKHTRGKGTEKRKEHKA